MAETKWGLDKINEVLAEHGAESAPWSSAVGPGWMPLLVEAVEKYRAAGWTGTELYFKEKFAGLRVDIEGHEGLSDDMVSALYDVCSDLCDRSYHICEECGAPGEVRTLPWYQTLCPTHFEEALAFYKNRNIDVAIKEVAKEIGVDLDAGE